MPNLPSRYQAGTWECLRESQLGRNGPVCPPVSTWRRSAARAASNLWTAFSQTTSSALGLCADAVAPRLRRSIAWNRMIYRQNYNIHPIKTQQLSLKGLAGSRAEGVPLDDSLALAHCNPLVGVNVLESLDGALWPTDADVGLDRVAQAEVHPKVALGNVIAAAAHFIDLFAMSCGHGDAGTDGIAAGCGHGPYQQSVAPLAEVLQQRRRLKKVDDHNFLGSIVIQVSDRDAARRVLRGDAGSRGEGHIKELPVSPIPEQLARLVKLFAEVILFNEGINVPVRYEQVLPAVVVDVHKGGAPFYVLGVNGQTGAAGDVAERAIAQVAVEGVGITREVGLEDVEVTIAVVIRGSRAHARLFPAILVDGEARGEADLLKRPVSLVGEVQTGRRIAGHKEVGPSIVIEIAGQDGEAIILARSLDAGLFGHVGEMAVTVVVVQSHSFALETPRAAGHGDALPVAAAAVARPGRLLGIEIDVVGHHEVEPPIPVVVDKGAAGAPTGAGTVQAALAGLVAKSAVSHVVEEHVVTPLADEQVHISVVIRVAGAHTLPPSEVADAGFLSDVLKAKPAEIVIKVRRKGHRTWLQPVALDQEYIRQSVVVVVEDSHSRAGVFDHEGLVQVAGDDYSVEPSLGCHIPKIDSRSLHARRERAVGLIRGARRNHLRQGMTLQRQTQDQCGGCRGDEQSGAVRRAAHQRAFSG